MPAARAWTSNLPCRRWAALRTVSALEFMPDRCAGHGPAAHFFGWLMTTVSQTLSANVWFFGSHNGQRKPR